MRFPNQRAAGSSLGHLTWEGPLPRHGLTSFWRLVVLGSLLWILWTDLSSSLLFLRLVSSIFPSRQFQEAARRAGTLTQHLDKMQTRAQPALSWLTLQAWGGGGSKSSFLATVSGKRP